MLNFVSLFLMRLFLVLVRLCRSLCHYLVLQSSFCGGELVVLNPLQSYGSLYFLVVIWVGMWAVIFWSFVFELGVSLTADKM